MSPANIDDTWPDSDDELNETDVETSVQLGIPDGPLIDPVDLSDPTVSRLGGRPTFLSTPPPPATHATCNNCSQLMELLLQIWCPMENSPNDRALFIWGCANASCQRKDGSIRAWRELRFNRKYAEKLQKNLARQKNKEAQEAKAAAELAAKKTLPKSTSNPFALGTNDAPNPFGLGSQIFGDLETQPSLDETPGDAIRTESAQHDAISLVSSPEPEPDRNVEASDDDAADDDALAAAVASASLSDSPWIASAAYRPLYLSTVAEYLPSPPKVQVPAGATVDADADDEDNSKRKDKDGSGGWAMEGYENSMDVDHAFERFSKRVSCEGEQCLRYDLGGTPLPFASDEVFDKLFPAPPAPLLVPVTKADFMVSPPHKRGYSREALPACPNCKSRRVFECQLMPNLINVLNSASRDQEGKQKVLSDQDRHAEVLRALKGGQSESGVRGMDWGTCMIFSCEKDCAAGIGKTATWREEFVLVQWDE